MKEFDKNLDKDIIAFMNSYKIIDDQEIYSNKTEFVPIFRVVQWLAYNKPFEEIERLNTLIDKYDKELTRKTEQYEYLRHYHNLSPMKQYPIERDLFCEIFWKIDEEFYDELYDITTESFKCWRDDDDFYILNLDSGTLINWYKHLGRCNTCNKELSVEEYKKLADDLYNELKGDDKDEK